MFLAEGLGPVTMSAKGVGGDVTCKILLEKKEAARNSGRIATCQSQITVDTEN